MNTSAGAASESPTRQKRNISNYTPPTDPIPVNRPVNVSTPRFPTIISDPIVKVKSPSMLETPVLVPTITNEGKVRDQSDEPHDNTGYRRPELEITIFENPCRALVDTGASVSAISEQYFTSLKSMIPAHQNLSILPVSGVTISTAVESRSRRVTQQVLIPFEINSFSCDCIFLVVPRLSTTMILGTDWLTDHRVDIKYSVRIFYFPIWDTYFSFSDEVVPLRAQLDSVFTVTYDDPEMDTPGYPIDAVSLSSGEPDRESFDNICENLRVNVNLTDEQYNKTVDLFKNYHSVFRIRPGLNKLYVCKFNVSEDVPFKIAPYPIPFARRPAVEHELSRMLEWGVIERCSSPYSNPILCVAKTDGSVRLCLDARRINRIILPMRDSSPPLEELLARFQGNKSFSSLDFTSGYWQVPLHVDVRKYTAFLYNGRTYQFRVVPFGLNISNTAFQQALEAALANPTEEPDEDVVSNLHIYVDDVLVSARTFDEHLHCLKILFEKILVSGMSFKFEKCKFFQTSIKFLGHIVTPEGVKIDPAKLDTVQSFPCPRNKRDVQSFIGFCNFYRRFADHHADLVAPLIELVKKDVPFRFGPVELTAFERIKNTFNENVLSHPNFNLQFCIQTDASKLALGVELFQFENNNVRKTISFASRTLNSAERNYTVTELELLSIVFACEKFRTFILGYPIKVYTDHKALTFLFRCRLRNARLTRWTLALQEFDLHIQYISGPNNIIDFVSRNPPDRDELQRMQVTNHIFSISKNPLKTEHKECKQIFKTIIQDQGADPKLRKIISLLSEPLSPIPRYLNRYSMYDNVLHYRRFENSNKWLICIPRRYVVELILTFHRFYGHTGPKKCILAIKESCFYPSLYNTTRAVIKSCDTCQRTKFSTVRMEGAMQNINATAPLDKVCVDLYGPLPSAWNGVKYIFVVLDCFTRFVRLFSIKRATALIVTNRMIDSYVNIHGKPKFVLSDHGVQFTSKIWQARLSDLNINVTMTSVYHPQSNPAERVMRELGRFFRTYCSENHTKWSDWVPYVEWVLNHTVHESTSFTPQELFLKENRYSPIYDLVEFPPGREEDLNKKYVLAREVQNTRALERKMRHDRRGINRIFKIGELVLVRTHRLSSAVDQLIHKFFLLYDGPFVISAVRNRNAYTVNDPDTNRTIGTYNVIFLREYIVPIVNDITLAECVDNRVRP